MSRASEVVVEVEHIYSNKHDDVYRLLYSVHVQCSRTGHCHVKHIHIRTCSECKGRPGYIIFECTVCTLLYINNAKPAVWCATFHRHIMWFVRRKHYYLYIRMQSRFIMHPRPGPGLLHSPSMQYLLGLGALDWFGDPKCQTKLKYSPGYIISSTDLGAYLFL